MITREQLDQACAGAEHDNLSVCSHLVRLGMIDGDQLAEALARYLESPHVKINPAGIKPDVVKLVDEDMAVGHGIFPVQHTENLLTLAISAPIDVEAAEMISFKTGCTLDYVICTVAETAHAIKAVYGKDLIEESREVQAGRIEFIEGDRSEPPENIEVDQEDIIELVSGMMSHAIEAGASDIHIEPKMDHADVRLRIDGILTDYRQLPGEQHHAVVSRIKILANLDIAERRRPQDGVIFARYGDKDVDFRIASAPSIYGEGVVLRVLDQGKAAIELTDLGFSKPDMDKIMKALAEPYGFVLSTGPTGSGKTTTMYAMLNKLNRSERKIVTIEDPVEYRMENINQIPVNHAIELGFAPLLRSVLRQDPNIILVGEIRDEETAHVAVQAALTGHLLLSTLHTTDAPEVLLRLMEIGIEHYYVREVVKVIIAQRLARKLCPSCKKEYPATADELKELGIEAGSDASIFSAVGCPLCLDGYSGRIGIYEVMPMSPEIKDMMAPDVRLNRIRELAISEGMRTLWQNASDKVVAGETTIEEIRRTIPR